MNNKYIDSILIKIKHYKANIKTIKSGLWILAKMIKLDKSGKLNATYNIVDYMSTLFYSTTDFGLKGSIFYIFSYLSGNIDIKNELCNLGWFYFKNRDIAFNRIDLMQNMSNQTKFYSNIQGDIMLNKYVKLDPENEEYYNQFCLLLNTITYKQAYTKLRELYKSNNQIFTDPKLIVKILHLLCNYRYQQQLRQFIFSVIDFGLSNVYVMEKISGIVNSIGNNII